MTANKSQDFYWQQWAAPWPVLELPTDFSRVQHARPDASLATLTLTPELSTRLRLLSHSIETSLHNTILTGFMIFLYRYTNSSDLPIGLHASVANKATTELSNLIFPARTDMSKQKNFLSMFTQMGELLKQVEQYDNTALQQAIPQIQENYSESFFRACFALHNENIDPLQIVTENASVELMLLFHETATDLKLSFAYDPGLFAPETIQRMLANFQTMLESISISPELPFFQVPMLSQLEQDLLDVFHQTDAPYPDQHTIHQLFEEQVLRTPGQVAVRYKGQELTYAELDARVNQFAHYLRSKGYRRDTFVALVLDRSIEMIISILAVLKSGGAYLPIDPEAPQTRIDYLLEDSRTTVVITRDHLRDRLSNYEFAVVVLDELSDEIGKFPTSAPDNLNAPTDLAYIIYTSGSTGKPKGTLLAHRGVCNHAITQGDLFKVHNKSRVLQFASFSFDASVLEIFFALLRGATLVLAPAEEVHDSLKLLELLDREKITFMLSSPALIAQLPLDAAPHLEVLVTGGEACPSNLAANWAERVHLINAYGPTEITVAATAWSSQDSPVQNPLPIGRPLANSRIYILDSANNQQPIGVPGEICIEDPGIALGYLNRPDLTREKFIPHPFKPGMRLYRSGDLGRYRSCGNIEYLGRIDKQVKIRGHRIEISEIEHALNQHPEVKESVVIINLDPLGSKRLVSYVVTRKSVQSSELRQFLHQSLPDYMIPSHIIRLSALPVNINGKIDQNALPNPEDIINNDPTEYVQPETDLQRQIAETWQHVLGLKRIGIQDNFFEIGGHSLNILPILVRLKPLFPALSIQDFYQHQTVAELEKHLLQLDTATKLPEIDPGEIEELEAHVSHIAKTTPAVPASSTPSQHNITLVKPLAVLLTGATGFLGAHILYDLLHDTDAHVYCLVRPSAQMSVQQRLTETMVFYFGTDIVEKLDSRVTTVIGDLSEEGLGWSHEEMITMQERIDTIIHCGADVRHYGKSDHFQKVNVLGTECLLDMAKKRPEIHFHFVSTLSNVMGYSIHDPKLYVPTENDFDRGQTLENPYAESKFEAEKKVRQAMQNGIRATVYRIGNLIGHSSNGQFQQNIDSNGFYRSVKATLMLGATALDDSYVDLSPVNYVSRALVHLVCRPESVSRTFHLCNPKQVSYTSFIQTIQSFGYAIMLMKPEVYQQWVFQENPSKEHHEAVQLILTALLEANPHGTVIRFDSTLTQQMLKGSQIQCPEPDHTLLYRIFQYAINLGYFPASRLWNLLENHTESAPQNNQRNLSMSDALK